ncbi:hypothetical protein J25TS5_36550 [Paenibacillus faecis]|uniref:hypothetical protein n=1 Tax=Paenibacillus faecis TaxID=862114 RepID=UPI001B21BD37|nr:hypothetical protein [Paenibacillus faecis]GIO86723.1 hypothetical protein J25TS5_36550 [Paenibacillus faecis]
MNESLKRNINKLKAQLASDPDSILIGQIHEGNPRPEIEDKNGVLAEYIQFLQECDGARLGRSIFFLFVSFRAISFMWRPWLEERKRGSL